jgi:glycerol-3-phosphate acyltransferase PlsY
VVLVVTRYASVASIVTALALVSFVLLLGYDWPVLAFAAAGTVAIVLLHRHNLSRLAHGTEHRFELHRPRRA